MANTLPGFRGVWFSTFGELTIEEEGASARGAYTHKGGRIEATRKDDVLRGTWSEPEQAKEGSFELTLDAGNNTFRGVWREQGAASWQGQWNGVRLSLPSAEEGGTPGGWNSYLEGPLLSGPMVGEAGETDARVWVQARDTSRLTLTVYRSDGAELRRVAAEPAWDAWLCVVFVVDGLSPGEIYEYTIESAHGATPRHKLRAAPPKGARRLRIAFGSCFDDYARELPIFDAIRREDADLFLMIGDNCYFDAPDWQTQHTMMMAQLRNRNNASIRGLIPDVPVLGIWDDHDFGPNDSDSTFASGRTAAFPVFKRMWAQRAYGTPETPGIFSTVRVGPVELFLLDGRYHRLENREILGCAQLAWLKDALLRSDAPVKLIVSGSQVLPEVPVEKLWECWRKDAPGELEELLSFIEERGVEGVVFVSGDVHMGYLIRCRGRALADGRRGPDFWELTSSPLANNPWTEHLVAGGVYDSFILEEATVTNYGVVDIDLDRPGREVIFTLKDDAGAPLFGQALALFLLQVRAPASKLSALGWTDGAAHFFQGERSMRQDLTAIGGSESAPESPLSRIYGRSSDVDAAVVWDNGKAFFFKGNGYRRYDIAGARWDAGYPRYIATNWRGLFAGDIDAAVVWDNGKAYFFKGSEYIRYDIATDRADPGYPRPIAAHWPGLWADGIDAAVLGRDGKAYFFKGGAVIRYDLKADQADPGYPRPIEGALSSWFAGA